MQTIVKNLPNKNIVEQLKKYLYLKNAEKIWETYLHLYQEKSLPKIPSHLHSEVFRWIVHGSTIKCRKEVGIKILEMMTKHGLLITETEYYNLLYLYFRERNYEEAHQLFDSLINNQRNFWASDSFCALYTHICLNDHKFQTVIEIYFKAKKMGCSNLCKTKLSAMQAYGQLGQLEEAEELFEQIKDKFGLLPFKSIINCFIINNQVDKIEPLYTKMMEKRLVLDSEFFEIMCDFYFSAFDKDNVKIWLQRALQTPFVHFTDEQIRNYLT